MGNFRFRSIQFIMVFLTSKLTSTAMVSRTRNRLSLRKLMWLVSLILFIQTVASSSGTELRNLQANANLSQLTEDQAIDKLCEAFAMMETIGGIRQPYKSTFGDWDEEYSQSNSLESLDSIASTILPDQNEAIMDKNNELKDIKGADNYLEHAKPAREARKVENSEKT